MLLQPTGIVNNYYKTLPELEKQNVLFFVEDLSACFVSSFVQNSQKPLNWHVVLKPDKYWETILDEELQDGKIKSLLPFNRENESLADIGRMKQFKQMRDIHICIIA